jgi:enamine deaminase RidA (YjgF/YER057c/UK114 family)
MERQRISSGAAFEARVGYSRAVRVGHQIWVAGTAPIPADGSEPPADAYAQARLCFEIIGSALASCGAGLDDVVRSRMYLTSAADIAEVGRAHLEALGTARPASTAVVTALLDPRWRVEIEVDAVVEERS